VASGYVCPVEDCGRLSVERPTEIDHVVPLWCNNCETQGPSGHYGDICEGCGEPINDQIAEGEIKWLFETCQHQVWLVDYEDVDQYYEEQCSCSECEDGYIYR